MRLFAALTAILLGCAEPTTPPEPDLEPAPEPETIPSARIESGGFAGRTATVTIEGTNTAFDASTLLLETDAVDVKSLVVESPTRLVATLAIDPLASLGKHELELLMIDDSIVTVDLAVTSPITVITTGTLAQASLVDFEILDIDPAYRLEPADVVAPPGATIEWMSFSPDHIRGSMILGTDAGSGLFGVFDHNGNESYSRPLAIEPRVPQSIDFSGAVIEGAFEKAGDTHAFRTSRGGIERLTLPPGFEVVVFRDGQRLHTRTNNENTEHIWGMNAEHFNALVLVRGTGTYSLEFEFPRTNRFLEELVIDKSADYGDTGADAEHLLSFTTEPGMILHGLLEPRYFAQDTDVFEYRMPAAGRFTSRVVTGSVQLEAFADPELTQSLDTSGELASGTRIYLRLTPQNFIGSDHHYSFLVLRDTPGFPSFPF